MSFDDRSKRHRRSMHRFAFINGFLSVLAIAGLAAALAWLVVNPEKIGRFVGRAVHAAQEATK